MATVSEEISQAFLEFDIEITDEEIMVKLEEIYTVFSLDADDLVNEWLAYQSRNNQQPLSYEELEQLERELSSTRTKSQVKSNFQTSPAISLNVTAPSDTIEAMDIIESYCSPNNKGKLRSMHINTPIKPEHKKPQLELSPSVFSPVSESKTPSMKYANRSNSGEVVAELGNGKSPETTFWHQQITTPKIVTKSKESINETYKYMFQKVMDVCNILNDSVESFADEIQQQYQTSIESYAPCSASSQGEVTVIGRIKNESQARLTSHSVLLEGDRVNSFGRSINVELDQVAEYSLFSGQIVAMRGINPTGKKFVASHIFKPSFPDGKVSIGCVDDFVEDSNKAHIVVAAGPFTTSDSLSYEPLEDFITVVKRSCPDVTVLIGPLVDADHEDVGNGMIASSFAEFSQNWINYIRNALEKFTQIVFIPSQRDVFHHPVYPQPPYLQKKSERSFFLANPSCFDVCGFQVGATAADVLFHLGAEEISRCLPSSSTDRLARLTEHLFSQKSFYPLYPAHESVSLDVPAAEFACRLPTDLDILLLPSDLRCFVKCINGRLCVNPGRLAKGFGGGTYARIAINGSSEKKTIAHIVKI